MKTNPLKFATLSILWFIMRINLMAQPQISVYTDLGKNCLNDGLFIKTACLADYKFGKYKVDAGIQLDLKSNNTNVLSGYSIKFSRNFLPDKFPFDVQGFYILAPFSDVLRQTNWGFLMNINRKHLAMSAGTNFRTYALTTKEIRIHDFHTNTKIHEVWNFMYSFSYFVKPMDKRWNVFLAFSDFDNFTISQETNPVLKLGFWYKFDFPISLFVESCYKSAGILNTNVNFFESFIRIGIKWNVK